MVCGKRLREEVRMEQRLFGRYSLFGWINKEFLKKVQSLSRCIRNYFFERDRVVLRKCDFIVVWQLRNALKSKISQISKEKK